MNSFVNSADRVRSVHRGMAEACDPILAEIPADADLLDPDVDLDAVKRLLHAACQVRWVLVPVATKVLHRKRPRLIPMLDSVVNGYYLDAKHKSGLRAALEDGDHGERAAGAAMAILRAFRDDLRATEPELTQLQADLGQMGYELTLVRLLELLLWVGTEPRGYYRARA